MKKSRVLALGTLFLLFSLLIGNPLTAQEQTPEAETASEFGPNPAQFISLGEEDQTVNLVVIAAFDDTNGGFNFNGFTKGNATYRVPQGWTVNVTYRNYSGRPHSAVVVPSENTDDIQIGDPVFEGAGTQNPIQGTTTTETFTFTASEEGRFAIGCAVPTHAANGQWIWFEVGPPDSQPSFQIGEQEPYVPQGQPEAAKFIRSGEADETVEINLIASYDETNDGLNFNGYANGEAIYRVPQGWTVNVTFQNYGDVPHSAILVSTDATDQQEFEAPAFEGAAIEGFTEGTTRRRTFSFTASEEGQFALACGVPGHAAEGHWIVLEVVSSDAQPSLQLGDEAPYEPEQANIPETTETPEG